MCTRFLCILFYLQNHCTGTTWEIVYLYSMILRYNFPVCIPFNIFCSNHPFHLFYCFIFIHIWLSIHCHKMIHLPLNLSFRLHSLLFIWDFFEFNDNNCFVRYSMIASSYFNSLSRWNAVCQNVNYKPQWIISNFFGNLFSEFTLNICLKFFISFNILTWFTFVSFFDDCSKLVSFNIIFLVSNCYLSWLKYPTYQE